MQIVWMTHLIAFESDDHCLEYPLMRSPNGCLPNAQTIVQLVVQSKQPNDEESHFVVLLNLGVAEAHVMDFEMTTLVRQRTSHILKPNPKIEHRQTKPINHRQNHPNLRITKQNLSRKKAWTHFSRHFEFASQQLRHGDAASSCQRVEFGPVAETRAGTKQTQTGHDRQVFHLLMMMTRKEKTYLYKCWKEVKVRRFWFTWRAKHTQCLESTIVSETNIIFKWKNRDIKIE